MTVETSDAQQQNTLISTIRAELPFFLLIVGGIFLFRGLFFNMNYIPSESMQPTLEVGDRIIVNKLAYGYSGHSILFSAVDRLPGKYGRLFGSLPSHGDVITFKNPISGKIFIKRVIGLPGDRVQYVDGNLFLNGDLVQRSKVETVKYKQHRGGQRQATQYRETLDGEHYFDIFEFNDVGHNDNTDVYSVPEGHVFVMGDNRDNSEDSRNPHNGVGFLPIENIHGRAERVLFSTYRCKKVEGLRCAERKLFSKIK